MFGLFLSGSLFHSEQIWFFVLQTFGLTLAFMYASGMVIVHYNILLDDEKLLGSALNNFSKEDDQKKMSVDPPAYSQVV